MSAPGPLGPLESDYDRGPSILIACSITTALAFITFCARIWVRARIVHSVGRDDYVMAISMILSLAGFFLIIPEVHYGAGRHLYYLDPASASLGLKINYATQPIYLYAITLVKISIALFLLRIAATDTIYRKWLWGMIAFLLVFTTMCFITILIQCTNLAVMWDPNVKATCWKPHVIRSWSYTNSAVCIITDLMFATAPIPMLWNVKIETRIKASLLFLMGLGVFAAAASIVKMSYIANYGKAGDFLWDSANLTIWTVTECNTGIIAASLACLKPLFRSIFGRSEISSDPEDFGLSKFPPTIGGSGWVRFQQKRSLTSMRAVEEQERDAEASRQEDILHYLPS